MKECKYCKTEINKKAKVCPNCHKSQSNTVLKILIIIVVILVCVVGCMSACAKGASDAVDKVTSKKDNLKLEEDSVTNTSDEYSYYIEGFINNSSDEKFDYVQVTYTTYDADGNTIGTCVDNNSGLDAMGRWKFKAMCLDNIDSIASYKLTEITGY